MTGTLRVAVLSGVRHAAGYIEALGRQPGVELLGVGEAPDAPDWAIETSRRVAREFGLDWLGLGAFGDMTLDAAVVCTEPVRHAAGASYALDAGLHVLVDKPLAINPLEAVEIARRAAEQGVLCGVVNRVLSPALQRGRQWIDAGKVGLPRHLDVEFLASATHFASSVERPELVIDPSLSGGGEMLNFLGYCVDGIRYLTGLEVEDVFAMTTISSDLGHREFGVEDTAVVSLGLERGVQATVSMGRVPFAPTDGPTASSIRIIGSHGLAVLDDERPALSVRNGDGGSSVPLFGIAGAVAVERYLAHFLDSVRTGTPLIYDASDALQALRVIEAAYKSASSGAVVAVSGHDRAH